MTILHTDFYKTGHHAQMPDNTQQVFSNGTFRKSRLPGIRKVIFFSLQGYIQQKLIQEWNQKFFSVPRAEIMRKYERRMRTSGIPTTIDHIGALHDHGRLPVEIWALPEGSAVPIGVPPFVIFNTEEDEKFSWLVNYLETDLSCNIWKPSVNATIAREYRRLLTKAMEVSGGPMGFVDWQGHDFSYRGMSGTQDAITSGAAHLLSFYGTDTIPAIDWLEEFYGADADKEIIGGSVPATEHSVMCMGTKMGEKETYERLLRKYRTGILSLVSDTWDIWEVLTKTLPALKDLIMSREGKLVIRPDSVVPDLIICGDPKADRVAAQHGVWRILADTFGTTTNEKGFKLLDPHVGAIYGDSITPTMADKIVFNLIRQGFVPTIVLGIGSYTYQMVTRDTFGFAIKATAGIVDGEVRELFKDPVTDDGTKRSAKGYVAVYKEDGEFYLRDRVSMDEVRNCAFQLAFKDSKLMRSQTLADIRRLVRAS